MDSRTLISVSLFLLVMILAIGYAAWRVQRHIAERAEAERRMGAALEELHRLTTELRARQGGGAGGAGAEAGGAGAGPGPAGSTGPASGAEGGR